MLDSGERQDGNVREIGEQIQEDNNAATGEQGAREIACWITDLAADRRDTAEQLALDLAADERDVCPCRLGEQWAHHRFPE